MFFVSPKKVCDGYMKVSLNKLSKGFEQNGYIIDQENYCNLPKFKLR